jgi:hypothetical protein
MSGPTWKVVVTVHEFGSVCPSDDEIDTLYKAVPRLGLRHDVDTGVMALTWRVMARTKAEALQEAADTLSNVAPEYAGKGVVIEVPTLDDDMTPAFPWLDGVGEAAVADFRTELSAAIAASAGGDDLLPVLETLVAWRYNSQDLIESTLNKWFGMQQDCLATQEK